MTNYSTNITDLGRVAKGTGVVKYDTQVSSLDN